MRNEPRSTPGVERPAVANQQAAASTEGPASPTSSGRSGMTRGSAAIDAQILQDLRDRLRTTGSLESVAGEALRLGTLAAAVHRGSRRGLPTGTRLAVHSRDATVDRTGVEVSEDAA